MRNGPRVRAVRLKQPKEYEKERILVPTQSADDTEAEISIVEESVG